MRWIESRRPRWRAGRGRGGRRGWGPWPVLGVMASLAAGAVLLAPEPAVLEGRPRVVDGDSLRMGRVQIRLKGLDAPERNQVCRRGDEPYDCGQEARRALQDLVARETVTCRAAGKDRYRRVLAHCSVKGRDVGAEMVSRGQAIAYGGYGAEEDEARRAGRGLWAGTFQRPDEWRAARRGAEP